jgi:hypothetical protein
MAWLDDMAEIVSVEFTTSEYCEYVLHRMYYRYHTERPGRHGYTGSHCLIVSIGAIIGYGINILSLAVGKAEARKQSLAMRRSNKRLKIVSMLRTRERTTRPAKRSKKTRN